MSSTSPASPTSSQSPISPAPASPADQVDAARLPLLDAESAPEASRPFVVKAIANNGFLPNLIAVLANSPAALETYVIVSGINARTNLTLLEREVVQITAASIHGCDFCVAGHSAIVLKKGGLDTSTTIALQTRRRTGNARFDAIADFTRAVIVSRGNVGDGEYADFLAAGFDAGQAVDVVLGVALATLCNFTNSLARSEINPQLDGFRPGRLQP